MTATLERELSEVAAAAEVAARLVGPDLAPRYVRAGDRFLRESLQAAVEVTQALSHAWAEVCSSAVTAPPAAFDRARWLNSARAAVALLGPMADVAAKAKADEEAELRRLLAEFERLAADLAAAGDGDLMALALKWFPLDEEAFARGAGRFVPTQAMLDEDWSDLIPRQGG